MDVARSSAAVPQPYHVIVTSHIDQRKGRCRRFLHTAHGDLEVGARCLVMGILNVTPDSFSDGGEFYDARAAVARALQLQVDGADIIDIGGESTRPGSAGVAPGEQIRRVVPVIRAARAEGVVVPISIDTRSSAVAAAALDAGADIVNDVAAARHDPDMPRLLAGRSVPFVIMHMQGTPETMQENPSYADVVTEVMTFFQDRAERLAEAGVDIDRNMIVDPGIGFGKNLDHNLALLRSAACLGNRHRAGIDGGAGPWPVLVGPSRKRFLRAILAQCHRREVVPLSCHAQGGQAADARGNVPTQKTDRAADAREGSQLIAANAAVAVWLASLGVDIVRVHDVREMRAALRVYGAIRGESR